MVGPYVTARLAPKLLFDGRVSWGRSNNEITPSGTYTDEFASKRWLISAALIGDLKIDDQLTVLPEARLSWYREESEAYVDGLDVNIASSTVETGSLEFGPTLQGNFDFEEAGQFSPFVGMKGIWTFANEVSSDDAAENPPQAEEGVRARVEMGVDMQNNLAEGLLISLSGFIDGIGDDSYEVYGGSVRVRQRF